MKRFAIVLLLALSVQYGTSTATEQSNIRAGAHPSYAAAHQRRELSMSDFWSSLLMALGCLPGPGHAACVARRQQQEGSTTPASSPATSPTTSSSSTAESSSSNSGSDNNGDGNDGNVYFEDSEYDVDGDGDGEYWEENNLGAGDNATSTSSAARGLIPFLAVAVVAGLIGAAIIRERRREEGDNNAPALKKRMKNFSSGVLRKNNTSGGTVPLNGAFIEIATIKSGGADENMSVRSGDTRSTLAEL